MWLSVAASLSVEEHNDEHHVHHFFFFLLRWLLIYIAITTIILTSKLQDTITVSLKLFLLPDCFGDKTVISSYNYISCSLLGSVEFRHFFSMKACHLPLKSVAALQHLSRLKESLQSVKLINLRWDVKMTNVAFLSGWYGWYKFDWWNKRAILIHLYLPLHLSTLKAYKNTPELS